MVFTLPSSSRAQGLYSKEETQPLCLPLMSVLFSFRQRDKGENMQGFICREVCLGKREIPPFLSSDSFLLYGYCNTGAFQGLQREAEPLCQLILMANPCSLRDSARVYTRVYSPSPKQWKLKGRMPWDHAGKVSWNPPAPKKAN